MFEPKTVKKGDNGLSVLLLQEILIARGFKGKDGKPLTLDRAAVPIQSMHSPNTRRAARAFWKQTVSVETRHGEI